VENNLDYYLIHPVWNISEELKAKLDGIVYAIEAAGERVHYPIRDVDQDDPIGLRICSEHRAAMQKARKVIMWYDPTSHGSMFDAGMGFMAGKPLEILNSESIENITNDYEQFLIDYALQGFSDNHHLKPSSVYLDMRGKRDIIRAAKSLSYHWVTKDWEALFDFGMIFMAGKPFTLLNREEVEAQVEERKSYQKVLITLDDMYRGKK